MAAGEDREKDINWRDVEIKGLRKDVDRLFQQHDLLNTSVASEYRALSEKMEHNRREHDEEHADLNKGISSIKQSVSDIHTETMLRKQQRESKETSRRWIIGIILTAIPVIIALSVIGVGWLDKHIERVVVVREAPR